ncbi:LysM peptidoglycan-binding domain-containing protein [Heyndrickxia sporothermodurans]|uniref:C40 family peptidase n=1 Tax=Heyndrickxia sporothermodurans TaxID=46224 RepID=UPI001FD0AD7D|nr:peptidoglycan endopeptidase [Heyndrickxia sporothermodurans]
MKKTFVSVAATTIITTAIATPSMAATYKVKNGDSLWKIANKYDTTVANLKKLNNLKSDMIKPNQVLTVSKSTKTVSKVSTAKNTSTSKTYTVKKGDSLSKIANMYKVSVANLKSWNHLKSNIIYPGDKLKVSSQNSTTSQSKKTAATNKTTSPTTTVGTSYLVKSGDTLSKIGKQFGVSVAELKKLNKLTSDMIYVGQKLIIKKQAGQATTTPKVNTPAKSPSHSTGTTYIVKSGDTLSKIGKEFGVSVAELKKLNKLTSDMIYVGQKLNIKQQAGQTAAPPKVDKPAGLSSTFSVKKVIDTAKKLVGTPYVWAGATPSGFDCSGFIYYVYNNAGLSLPRISSEGYYNRSYYVTKSPQQGDLVFFTGTYKSGISHLGIYIGNNQFIHASSDGVQLSSLDNSYWKSHFDGFKRLYDAD